MKSSTLNLWLHGSSGQMGKEIQQLLASEGDGWRLVGGSSRKFEGETFLQGRPTTPESLAEVFSKDKVEVVFDFSTPDGSRTLLEAVKQFKGDRLCILVGTTGLAASDLQAWQHMADGNPRLSVLIAPNTSVGIMMFLKAALASVLTATQLNFDFELVESHHRRKKDAPSGTARLIVDALNKAVPGLKPVVQRDGPRVSGEIGMHSVRGGGIFGEHELRMIHEHEELRITHRAFSRKLFASGALVLGRWLSTKAQGTYQLADVSLDQINLPQRRES